MNSPEEKAKELVEKFSEFTFGHFVEWSGNPSRKIANAKQCAILCVDEIIAALNKVVDDSMNVDDAPGSIGGANYYQQVKEAIQKL